MCKLYAWLVQVGLQSVRQGHLLTLKPSGSGRNDMMEVT